VLESPNEGSKINLPKLKIFDSARMRHLDFIGIFGFFSDLEPPLQVIKELIYRGRSANFCSENEDYLFA